MPKNRVTNACDRCRLMKIKCSELKPCSRCIHHNLNCMYQNSTIPESREDEQFIKLSGINNYNGNQNSEETLFASNLSETRLNYKLELGNYCPDSRYFDRLFPRLQNLLLVSICQNNTNITRRTQNDKFKIPRIQHYGWNMSGANYFQRAATFPMKPSFDMLVYHSDLLSIFENDINPLFSILSAEFLRNLNNMPRYELDASKARTKETLFTAILYAVYALSIRFKEYNKLEKMDEEMLRKENECFQYAYEVINLLSFDYTSIDIVRGWLLISIYLRIAHRQKTFLSAFYQANLMAKCMYLHRKIDNRNSKGTELFWSLFILDQLFSIQLGLTSFWRIEDISIPFPDEYHISFNESGFSFASFAMLKISIMAHKVIELHRIGSNDSQVLFIKEVCRDLANWLESTEISMLESNSLVDGKFKLTASIKAQIMLHFHDVLFSLNGPLLFNYVDKKYGGICLSIEELIHSMEEVVNILESLKKLEKLQLPWYLTLIHIFSIGSFSLTMINGGVSSQFPRELFFRSLDLAIYLSKVDQNVYVNGLQRFNMVREVIWALSQGMNSILSRFNYEKEELSKIVFPEVADRTINSRRFGDLDLTSKGKLIDSTDRTLTFGENSFSILNPTDPTLPYSNFDWMDNLFDDYNF